MTVSAWANLISNVENEHPSMTQHSSCTNSFWNNKKACLSLFFPFGSNTCLSRWCTGIFNNFPSLTAKVDFPLPGKPINANRLGGWFFLVIIFLSFSGGRFDEPKVYRGAE